MVEIRLDCWKSNMVAIRRFSSCFRKYVRDYCVAMSICFCGFLYKMFSVPVFLLFVCCILEV